MARHVVLLLSSDTQRRAAWYASTRDAGHYALHAPTLERALFLVSKVRPSLVLTEGALEDGRVLTLLHHLRSAPPLQRVVVIVLGDVSAEEQDHIASDAQSYLRPFDAHVGQIVDEFLHVA